jgi:hypothetical protein
MKVLERVKDIRGDINLYDISEYRGKIYLSFHCDFHPYQLTYLIECAEEAGNKKLMSIYELSVENDEKLIKGHCGFYIDE